MARGLHDYIIPPSEDGVPRCKLCYSVTPLDEQIGGVCFDCADAIESRYKQMILDYFEEDEIAWLAERDETTADVSEWLREVAHA